MDTDNTNEKLQSRREFFKKAAKKRSPNFRSNCPLSCPYDT